MTVARRSLIAGGTAGVGLVVAGAVPSLAEASPAARRGALRPNARPFPPLIDDPQGLLALPPGFRYTVVTRAGETQLDDGSPTPSKIARSVRRRSSLRRPPRHRQRRSPRSPLLPPTR